MMTLNAECVARLGRALQMCYLSAVRWRKIGTSKTQCCPSATALRDALRLETGRFSTSVVFTSGCKAFV